MKLHALFAAASVFLVGATSQLEGQTPPTPVSLELALISDVSGSVDNTEFSLVRNGYVAAFNNFSFWEDFGLGGRSLAVSYSYWSGTNQQSMMTGGTGGWYFVNSGASAASFATAISGFVRPFNGLTAPGSAINWITPQFATNAFAGTRQVIDIAADGCAGEGANTSSARTASQNLGIVINAITIGTENSACGGLSLANWYQTNAVTVGGFLETASTFDDFEDAIERKIGREAIPESVPEPASMLLIAVGGLGLGIVARRHRVV